ncbi:MAG TPA: hypothetical protein VF070_06380 [Streptosporangiaceae bacterium]
MNVARVAGVVSLAAGLSVPAHAPAQAAAHLSVSCGDAYRGAPQIECPDVYDPLSAFGHYVGHDEPGVWSYSQLPGSGNRARWLLHIPTDPAPGAGISYSFQQHIAFWFGMALCATRSFPEQLSTCRPDSDANIVDPKVSPRHPGAAYLELQFYPPGYAPFPSGISCDPTRWCAAMNVWSNYVNPVTGQMLNSSCTAQVGGVELDNFAFVTLDGKPIGPPDPLHWTAASFTPDNHVLFMNQGDTVRVTVSDSLAGLRVSLGDLTSGKTGTMTASAANGFAQMVFAPSPSTLCQSVPYTFHPMYSTSSIETRATWTAFPYNIAYSDETGHFDYCSQVDTASGTCTGTEGAPGDQEAADADDTLCFAPSQATADQIGGCTGTNHEFDGVPYLNAWPNGQRNRPTPVMFTSPLTGPGFTTNYQRTALVAPLPFNEQGAGNQPCDTVARTGCTLIPVTDDGQPARFYPYFYTTRVDGCSWGEGTDIPGVTVSDFGKQQQYGTYDPGVYYTGMGGAPTSRSTVFMHVFPNNPCPS